MSDISVVTGEEYYSGSFQDVKEVAKSLKIGEGKLAMISQEMVNRYQERADREIDGELERYYYTPIRFYNVYMPATATTVRVFPGMIRKLALYMTAGLLLTSEFQQMEPNMLEAAQNYINDSKRDLFEIIKFTRRIPGQQWKHNLRTAPPTMMPGYTPELNI
jgi:hypothetical protein